VAAAIVPVQAIEERRAGLAHSGRLGAVRKEEIEPAVVVEIECGNASGHCFDQIFVRAGCVIQNMIQPGAAPSVYQPDPTEDYE
jgi:hypothetical protein